MHLFHCPQLAIGEVALPDEEAHHAISVLRLSVGNQLGLLDGRGGKALGTVVRITKKECTVHVTHVDRSAREDRFPVLIACSPTKSIGRFEWMLEKCTEIGVDRITPLLTERTERAHLRHDRLLKVLVSAMKQSQRSWLPQLDPPMHLSAYLASDLPQQKLFGWCEGHPDHIRVQYRPNGPAVILIGPEGDFSTTEAGLLVRAGFVPVSLGTARLRTETAAVAACTWMNFAQQQQ